MLRNLTQDDVKFVSGGDGGTSGEEPNPGPYVPPPPPPPPPQDPDPSDNSTNQ